MPLSSEGKKVLSSMKGEYGGKKGEQVFYATMNKKKKQGDWEDARSKAMKKRLSKA